MTDSRDVDIGREAVDILFSAHAPPSTQRDYAWHLQCSTLTYALRDALDKAEILELKLTDGLNMANNLNKRQQEQIARQQRAIERKDAALFKYVESDLAGGGPPYKTGVLGLVKMGQAAIAYDGSVL